MTHTPECDRDRIARLEGEVRRLEAVAVEREKQVAAALIALGKASAPWMTLIFIVVAATLGYVIALLGK